MCHAARLDDQKIINPGLAVQPALTSLLKVAPHLKVNAFCVWRKKSSGGSQIRKGPRNWKINWTDSFARFRRCVTKFGGNKLIRARKHRPRVVPISLEDHAHRPLSQWPGRDSNPQAFRHRLLKPACMPIPPPGQAIHAPVPMLKLYRLKPLPTID
jgi:hypothetical protein